MDTQKATLLILLIVFLLAAPNTQRISSAQLLDNQQNLQEQRLALDLLNSSKYGDFEPANEKWLNITGLRKRDGYAWDLLPKVQAKAGEQYNAILEAWRVGGEKHGDDQGSRERYTSVDAAGGRLLEPVNKTLPDGSDRNLLPFFRNITGIIRGHWIKSVIGREHQSPVLNTSAISPQAVYLTKEYKRNITGHTGHMQLKLDEKRSESLQVGASTVREVRAEMTIKDERSSDDGWGFVLHGVHYLNSGTVLLTTSGERWVA